MNPQAVIRNSRKREFKHPHVPLLAGWHWIHGELEAHDHDYMEVSIILEGRGYHQTVFGSQPVRTGDAFIIRPRVWHGYVNCERIRVYNCCFGTELLARELAWFRFDPNLDHLYLSGPLSPEHRGMLFFRLDHRSLGVCRAELNLLARSLRLDSPHARPVQIGRLVLALGEIAYRANLEGRHKRKNNVPMHPSVQHAVRLIEECPSAPWTLETLTAKLSNIAPGYLIRLFRTHTGLAPIAYLSRHRAERAAALLVHTARPVKDIGSEVGWGDPNYFARCFKKFFACTPTAYRDRKRASPDRLGGRTCAT